MATDRPRLRNLWRGRRPIVALELLALAAVAVIALDQIDQLIPDLATDDDIVVDDAELEITTARLDEVERALDSLPVYPGTAADGARQGPCATDSGDLFQPHVSRMWGLENGSVGGVVQAIGDDLAELGWTVGNPNQFGDLELTLDSGDGWRATGVVYPTFEEDAVGVEVRIADARPCRLP